MTNHEIITQIQVTQGIDEALFTFEIWRKMGYKVKKGEHGIETRLWKYKNPKDKKDESSEDENEEHKGRYYLAKAYLFKESQVEKIEKKDE